MHSAFFEDFFAQSVAQNAKDADVYSMKLLKSFCLLPLLLSSCTLFSGRGAASFVLPDECSGEQVAQWTVFVADGENFVSAQDFSSGETVYVQPLKDSVCAVLAVPKNPHPVEWGTGTIWPCGKELCEQDAFAASVLLSLYSASFDGTARSRTFLSCFNWNRFMQACHNCENPWLLNKEKIMLDISRGSFTLNSIRLRE